MDFFFISKALFKKATSQHIKTVIILCFFSKVGFQAIFKSVHGLWCPQVFHQGIAKAKISSIKKQKE